ncbi:DUF547 domain-containing protein [Kistimonas scapharcae]|uniref:DUF547 domain-containing protein n=1 Tax=Kistimonas scapharcae TaxID=1036133 RepID=A0ABP8UZY4_9GAMM
MWRNWLSGIIIWCLAGVAVAAPKSEYWALWDRSHEKSTEAISHVEWQRLLDAYLIERPDVRLFDYGRVSAEDRVSLDHYLAYLAGLDPRAYNRREQMAYWINLYNALTVRLILDHYPVKSIRKLGEGFFSFDPWDDDLITVAGQRLTLNDIEHRILRPIWKDKRIHYAVNCASMGCPDLAASAYTGKNVDIQLEKAASRFINQAKGVRFEGETLYLSRIYDWYAVDFGDYQSLMVHLQQYAAAKSNNKLVTFKGRVRYDYDWDLNDAGDQ